MKMISILLNVKLFYSLREFGLSLYKNVDGNQRSDRNQLLLRGSELHIFLAQKILALMLTGILFFMAFPFYSYMRGGRPNVMRLLIPFIKPETAIGYHTNLGFQVMVCSSGLCGILAVELFMIELVSVYAQATDLIELSRAKSSCFD